MIRFKKDDGTDYPEWEEKSIESIASVFGGYAFDSKKMTSIPLKYQIVKMGNLYQGNLDLTRTPSYIEQINEKELNYLLQKGDIAITLTGTVNKHDYGYSYLFVDEENLLLNQRLGLIRKKDNNDSRFISYIVKGNTFLRQFYNAATGGTGNQTNVSTKSVEKISVLIPHPDEQKKIADFLSEVDNMISIQKQQLAAIEEQRKGVMQKIFSQEMRFKKDDGKDYPEWEEKAFYDVFALKPNNTLSRDKLNYCSGTVQNVHYGDILVKFGSNLDSNNSMIPYINDNIDISKYSEESYIKNGDIILADTAEDFSAGKVTEIFNEYSV